MYAEWSAAIQAALNWLVPIGLVGGAVWYVVWVHLPRQVYRSSHLFEFAPDAVYRAYYPDPDDDLTGHPDEGLMLVPSGDGRLQGRSKSDDASRAPEIWEPHPPLRGVKHYPASPASRLSHSFTPIESGTRVDTEYVSEYGPLLSVGGLLDRLARPLVGWFEASPRRAWLKQRGTPRAQGTASVPMVARSRAAMILAVVALAVISWRAGWEFGLGLTFVIFVHELGHVVAARCYRHHESSFVFVPFFGGLANVGPSADYRELVVKVLGGPVFGLAACAAWLAVFAVLGLREGIALVPALVIVHGVNLLPLSILDGGQLARAVVISLGRVGRYLWVILGTLLLAAGAYLFLWLWRSWLTLPLFVFGAMTLYGDLRYRDELPKLGWRGILATLAAVLLLVGGHVALLQSAEAALTQDPIVELPARERVRGIYFPDSRLIGWSRQQGGWRALGEDRAPNWGRNWLHRPLLPGNRLDLRLRFSWPMRVDLEDGRQCLIDISPHTEQLWQPRRYVLDEATIAGLRCHMPAN